MIKFPMESTDAATVKNYPGPWLLLKKERTITKDHIWVFSDGSSSGWHGAIVIDPGKSVRKLAKFEVSPNRNINPEFNGAILGLGVVPDGSTVTVVHDLLGLGAWVIGEWNITKPAVKEKTDQIRKLIKDKNLTVNFVHHAGHQNKRRGERPICNSEFTKWNCEADKLCEAGENHDSLTVIQEGELG